MRTNWILLIVILLSTSVVLLTQGQAEEEETEACVTDEDCAEDDELVAEGRTTCCDLDGSMGCCDKGAKWDKIINMSIGIGCATVCLAIVIFLCMWCNTETFPCLKTCKEKTARKYEDWEDRQSCCAGRAEKRKQRKREEAVPKYETTDEIRAEVRDDFLTYGGNI